MDSHASRGAEAPTEQHQDEERAQRRHRSRFSTPFTRFYERHFHKLVNDLRASYGDGPPDPEDVAQQAFENLSRRDNLSAISSLERYVWIAARNIIYSCARKASVRQRNVEETTSRFYGRCVDEFDPERVSMAEEALSEVRAALATLPPRTRRIFLLNRVNGLSPAEIARRLGMGRTTVVYHIAKASEALYRAMEHGDPAQAGPES